MTYHLPRLNYDYDALEPFIDAGTMEIHHARHHAACVRRLNALLESRPDLRCRCLEDMLADVLTLPEEVRQGIRNHGGGHANHCLFWQVMGPEGGGQPDGPLAEGIAGTFGSFERFRSEFSIAAAGRFGSGWAWLGVDHKGALAVFSTANQDSPYMLGYVPILGIDVWEHAYYLRYRSRRDAYIEAWWNVVAWEKVARRYARTLEAIAHAR